jgi:hypothetical protein
MLGSRGNYSPVLDDNDAALNRLAAKSIDQGTTDNRRQHSRTPL